MLTPSGITSSELRTKGRKVLRQSSKQVLLIAHGERIFAIANRCPHEGYPLSEGTLGPDCVLTCNWHNWKFDLASGKALVGRDPVRSYPVGERDGEILIDLLDPPAEAQRADALRGLDAALGDNDRSRMAREVARLDRAGFDAAAALAHALDRVHTRLEDGMTHAHAAAADWLALASQAGKPAERLAALLEPLGHLAWDTQGAGEYPYAAGIAEWDERAFVAAIEAADEPAAIAHVRGALAQGVPYARMRGAFGEAALAHYAGFGHCAIYTLKAAS